MTHIPQPGNKYLLILFLLFACNNRYVKINSGDPHVLDSEFVDYSNIDTSRNYENNAVLSNIFGDYKGALHFASKSTLRREVNPFLNFSKIEIDSFRAQMLSILKDESIPKKEKVKAQSFLAILDAKTPDLAFRNAVPVNADSLILERSKDYHFLLINEAHYNSQHRAFTKSLLKPLWLSGFRYLALETLSYEDKNLTTSGIPKSNSGYYLKDPVFSALVRDAINLGYKLVPYETTRNVEGTLRDLDQAFNIYNQTLKLDKVGKVLIHAGYSHIDEVGSSEYQPLGAQLKSIVKQDILTVDQVTMTDLFYENQHPYYKYTQENLHSKTPVAYINTEGEVIRAPLNKAAVDLQVYHPKTIFKHNRPTWLITEGTRYYRIPSRLRKYKGFLFQVLRYNAEINEIPIDQVVIQNNTRLILKPNDYTYRLVTRQGVLLAKGNFKAN